MKIIKNNKPLFEIEIDGIEYISTKKKGDFSESCNGCLFFPPDKNYLCDMAHNILESSNCCTKNKIIFIKK